MANQAPSGHFGTNEARRLRDPDIKIAVSTRAGTVWVGLWALLTTAACGRASLSADGSVFDGVVEDGGNDVVDSLPGPDATQNEVSASGCEERAAPVLDCVVAEIACLTQNPCPATWPEAQGSCPLDGRMEVATTCGFNRWAFQPNDVRLPLTYCFYDSTTGALRTIRQTLVQDGFCKNTAYQRWIGPDLDNCDRTSFQNARSTTCPRSVPLPSCGKVDPNYGDGCSNFWYQCARSDGTACKCMPAFTSDDRASWICS